MQDFDNANVKIEVVKFTQSRNLTERITFQSSIACEYSISSVAVRREIAHSLVPKSKRIDGGAFVEVPLQTRHVSLRASAGPFGYTVDDTNR